MGDERAVLVSCLRQADIIETNKEHINDEVLFEILQVLVSSLDGCRKLNSGWARRRKKLSPMGNKSLVGDRPKPARQTT
jgi:hypothetical protein